VLEIVREVDRRHPATADLPVDPVAIGKSVSQTAFRIAYGDILGGHT
jgi:hypothetical protein